MQNKKQSDKSEVQFSLSILSRTALRRFDTTSQRRFVLINFTFLYPTTADALSVKLHLANMRQFLWAVCVLHVVHVACEDCLDLAVCQDQVKVVVQDIRDRVTDRLQQDVQDAMGVAPAVCTTLLFLSPLKIHSVIDQIHTPPFFAPLSESHLFLSYLAGGTFPLKHRWWPALISFFLFSSSGSQRDIELIRGCDPQHGHERDTV